MISKKMIIKLLQFIFTIIILVGIFLFFADPLLDKREKDKLNEDKEEHMITKDSTPTIPEDIGQSSITVTPDLNETKTGEEQLTDEFLADVLSDYSNYRRGWYKSWGGEYEETEGSLCTIDLYKITEPSYIYNVNDSRVLINIVEFDKDGKWIKYNDALINGDTFKKQPATVYIGVTISSKKWGVDLYTLFENGLRIDLATIHYMKNTESVSYSKAELFNVNRWKPGGYLYETGEYVIDTNKICYENFLVIDDKEYVVNLPGGYLKISILELDKEGGVVLHHELQSGQKWRKSENTNKIALTLYGNNKTLSVAAFRDLITDYPKIGLSTYSKYDHNTQMEDITAVEFINRVNVGWSLGNSLDAKSETMDNIANLKQELNWGNPYITEDMIDYITERGFNTIRIPVTWYYNTYRDEKGLLNINEAWLDRVQDVVDYGIENGLYVILNTHHEQPIIYAGTDENTMNQILSNAKALWTQIADHFKTYDEHLIFEAYNEVDNIERSWNYSDKAAKQMNELNQIFVDSVRGTGGNNAKRILMVPTLLDGADSRFYAGFKMPKDYVEDKIVVQLHTYTRKFNQNIESDFMEMEAFSKKINAPIMIGEFGTTPNYPLLELREEQASNFVARAAKYGIKCIWWDNGSDYQIVDRRDYGKSEIEMINALLEGSKGIGYELEDELLFNRIDQFAYSMPNRMTGELESTYWGTLTTDSLGSPVKVTEGSTCTISIKAINDATGIWIQRVLFYNALGKLLEEGKEVHSKYYIASIPEEAAEMRVSINSPNSNFSLEDFKQFLERGELEIVIHYFNLNDVKKVNLTESY